MFYFFSVGLCRTVKPFSAHAGTRPEEMGRKRASKKPAGTVKDLAYKPSRKPVLEPKSYSIRQGEQLVSQQEGEVGGSEGSAEVTAGVTEVPVSGEEDNCSGEVEFIEEEAGMRRGETTITYGYKIFGLTGEALKSKSGDEIIDVISRLCKGLFQGAKTVEECTFALAMAITRQVIPCGGKVFMENRSINNFRDLRECWCDWVSGRQKGNFYKMGSSGVSEGVRSGRLVRDSGSGSRLVLTCFGGHGRGVEYGGFGSSGWR